MTYKTYGFEFSMCAGSMKAAKMMSDKFAQFYGDSRIAFVCFYERHEGEIEFFGDYSTDDEKLMITDMFVIRSIANCPSIVFNEDEDVEFELDPRIKEMKREDFEEMIERDKFHSQDESDEIFDSMCETKKDAGCAIPEPGSVTDFYEDIENSENKDDYASVVYTPEALKNIDGEIQEGINETAFRQLKGGESALVMDEEEVKIYFERIVNALIEQDMRRY